MDKPRLEHRPETRALTVETLLLYVREGKIRIPEFQRPLRWRSAHVLHLFDSVYRGFPIGELLLSKKQAGAAKLHFGPVTIEASEVHDALFVVDGQQRVIALAGAMLRPEAKPFGDIHAVWFDLQEEQFGRPSRAEPPPHFLPLNVAGDSIRLLRWLNDWPFRNERPDLVERAIALSKAVREYQVPAYIVEGASEDALRVIFKRVNDSGVAMRESEVFEALFHARDPHPIQSACARLKEETGFGELSPEWFLRCLKVVEGADLRRSSTKGEDDAAELSEASVEHTENALRRAIAFLCDDAWFPHLQLMPYRLPLVVLARFFHRHPDPDPRTRTLLTRWVWRGALSSLHTSSSDATIASLQALIQDDEASSAQALLGSVPREVEYPSSTVEWNGRGAKARLCATAMVYLNPRDPDTGAPYTFEDVQAMLATRAPTEVVEGRVRKRNKKIGDIFLDVTGNDHTTVARCILLSDRRKLRRLTSASAEVLLSHGIDDRTLRALRSGDLAKFADRRAKLLDERFRRFFAERVAEGESDRPTIAEIARRARAVVAAHGRP
ncbi:DUF262 domain-containing protein [Sorangium sp. So ce295]|uniref:DUF262 domain-containing protein n=1 Tax=Sorangium sp. So ce295 TaxID=3133295 RepID=UPI003F5EAE3F